MSEAALIEEVEHALALGMAGGLECYIPLALHSKASQERLKCQVAAILPIIRAREIAAGGRVRDAVIPYIEDIAALTENPTYDPLEVGFRHSPLGPSEIRDRYARACAMAWQDTQNAIAALDIPSILKDEA